MKNDLIDRYVYAVTRNLPSKTKDDVCNELYTLIDDMLESRCGDILPTETEIKIVLTELGTPSELASKYNPDGDRYLIGPNYYEKYKFLLTIVLGATALGLAIASIVTAIIDSNVPWYFAIPSWFGMLIMGLLNGFAFVTLLFVIFQRKGIDVKISTDNLDNLPPVPKKKAIIPKHESLMGISISIIFAILFLIAPEILGVVFVNGTSFVPIFNTDVIKSIWYIIIAFAALGLIRDCYKLYEGRYTKRLAAVTVVTDILSAILTFIFLLDNRIINVDFSSTIVNLFQDDAEFISNIFSRFNIFFLCVILFALTLDMGVTVFNALKYDN
ncbi:hypothetical protein [Tissierella sp. Yu-01]|uniref:hypothetical protein n=1 Tax=Tissierella sp. Yu-01 TaxID=3035694 RepID=UPI00240E0CAC|nr:hypothetical protein [Tissierella sp. Yu-01]WFA09337.1 hypothetical protein P3962_01820 [Tissierella sp. Yu-01]